MKVVFGMGSVGFFVRGPSNGFNAYLILLGEFRGRYKIKIGQKQILFDLVDAFGKWKMTSTKRGKKKEANAV